MRKLTASAAAIALVLVVPAVAGAQTPPAPAPGTLSPAQAHALSVGVNKRVIIVLKNQVSQYPASRSAVGARRHAVSKLQSPVRAQLTSTKARNVKSFTAINAISATVSAGEAAHLAASPDVAEVVPDQIIRLAKPAASAAGSTSSSAPVPGACPAPGAAPLLTPEALGTIHADSADPHAATARSLGLTGSGVKVGFIADGLDINNTDFVRPDGSHVFVDYKDFSGEGTGVPTGGEEAFGDASSIAAQGRNVYDVSQYSALSLNRPCNIRVEGVAPGASLVGLDIFGAEDAGFNSSFLQAIDYAVSVDHVNVLNESLGNNYYPDDQASLDIIKQANDAAVAAGTTVTTSSGDAGVTSTIGTPATDPHVISVGASTTYQVPVQLGYGGAQFGVTGWLNDNISSLSSSGFTQDGRTISLVAPGELNWALCSTNTAVYSECTNYQNKPTPVVEFGGTSESAPFTAGVAALVIQAYEKTHGGAAPSPALVKQFITSSADDIQAPAELQGTGRIDAYRAALAAEQYRAPSAGGPNTVLEGTTQFTSIASGGASRTFPEKLTNEGNTATTVRLSSRTLTSYQSIETTTVHLSDAASPHSLDYQGIKDNYEVVHFHVPSGYDRLNASIAFKGSTASLAARVRMTLVDPRGRLADYSLPQGVGNYGNAQVAEPIGGTWTAYVWSRDTADGGTTGPVVFGADVARYKAFGQVTPSSVTIPAGSTRTVNLTVVRPKTPNDYAGSLVITPSGQQAQTVPVTLRTLVPARRVSFPGVLTGGNGRASFTGVTKYYQVDVPRGSSGLNASLRLADNRDNQSYVWLVDPSGQAQAFQSNGVVTSDSSGDLTYTNTLGVNTHVITPAAGRWTIIVVFAPAVSGTALREPFTLAVDEQAEPVSASGAPHGQSLSVNHPAVVSVKVTNHGSGPEAYFVDGRTSGSTRYSLPALGSADTTVPLNVSQNIPIYLVPSQTSALDATAGTTGSEPIQFDLAAPSGDPDVASGQGTTVTAGVGGNPVSSGVWDIAPTVVGPFGTTGATNEPVSTTLTATTRPFDPAVTSTYGDLWQAAIGGPISVSPIVVQPGKSAVIPVTIAPTGKPGTKVSGTLYLDDDSLYSVYGGLAPNANTVAAVPYSYTVGRD